MEQLKNTRSINIVKRINRNDLIAYVYIAFVALMCILAVAAIVGDICCMFKIITSDNIPFWMKWALLTHGGK